MRRDFVPVFGGPTVGKSSFLLAALRALTEHWAPPRGLAVTFPDSRVDSEIRRAWQNLAEGRPPAQTVTNGALIAQVDRFGQEGRLPTSMTGGGSVRRDRGIAAPQISGLSERPRVSDRSLLDS